MSASCRPPLFASLSRFPFFRGFVISSKIAVKKSWQPPFPSHEAPRQVFNFDTLDRNYCIKMKQASWGLFRLLPPARLVTWKLALPPFSGGLSSFRPRLRSVLPRSRLTPAKHTRPGHSPVRSCEKTSSVYRPRWTPSFSFLTHPGGPRFGPPGWLGWLLCACRDVAGKVQSTCQFPG